MTASTLLVRGRCLLLKGPSHKINLQCTFIKTILLCIKMHYWKGIRIAYTSLRAGGWGESQFRRGAYTVVLFIYVRTLWFSFTVKRGLLKQFFRVKSQQFRPSRRACTKVYILWACPLVEEVAVNVNAVAEAVSQEGGLLHSQHLLYWLREEAVHSILCFWKTNGNVVIN